MAKKLLFTFQLEPSLKSKRQVFFQFFIKLTDVFTLKKMCFDRNVIHSRMTVEGKEVIKKCNFISNQVSAQG